MGMDRGPPLNLCCRKPRVVLANRNEENTESRVVVRPSDALSDGAGAGVTHDARTVRGAHWRVGAIAEEMGLGRGWCCVGVLRPTVGCVRVDGEVGGRWTRRAVLPAVRVAEFDWRRRVSEGRRVGRGGHVNIDMQRQTVHGRGTHSQLGSLQVQGWGFDRRCSLQEQREPSWPWTSRRRLPIERRRCT